METTHFGVGIIGCGSMGKIRAEALTQSENGTLIGVYDNHSPAAKALAQTYHVSVMKTPRDLIHHPGVQIVIVSTPHAFLAPYALQALQQGKHVLIEKPGAISLFEMTQLAQQQNSQRTVRCKIGYHLRFHPAAQTLHQRLRSTPKDRVLWVRGSYGHGGRPGYEKQWRFQKELSGGGEVIDQGVHLLDLLQWWILEPFSVLAASRQNAFYPSTEEDNGFLLLTNASGTHAQLHCSATQWKNLFRVEIATQNHLYLWEGLGNKNYGPEKLTIFSRPTEGGAPSSEVLDFPEAYKESWVREWQSFYLACARPHEPLHSTPQDSLDLFRQLEQVSQKSFFTLEKI